MSQPDIQFGFFFRLWYRGANAFATRKTVLTSLINVALLTSTAGQLKSLMRVNPAYPFYNSLLGMLIVCILAEITMGILLFLIGRLNLNREEQRSRADLLQNIVTGIAVVVLILHIMNSAFGIEDLSYLAPGYNLVAVVPPRYTTTPVPQSLSSSSSSSSYPSFYNPSATSAPLVLLPFSASMNHTIN